MTDFDRQKYVKENLEGFNASFHLFKDDNPYEEGTDEYVAWGEGFDEGEALNDE